MSKYLIPIIILFVVGFIVFAQDDPFAKITYPIPELGNCENRESCEAFCELPDNMAVCLDFAETHNLIPQEEIEMARRMLALGATSGPGGCRGQIECEAFCDDISHIEECLDFALKNNLLPPDELQEAQKVAAAIKQGITPPNCRGKRDCDIYCSQPENMEECLEFAEAAGLIPPDELRESKMMLDALRQGITPPPCGSKEECDIYCSLPENMEECLDFATAAGFISQEEAAGARRMLEAGFTAGPGGCQNEVDCRAYCEKPEHFEECIDFAVKIGEMSPEEAAGARQGMEMMERGGPGDCKSEEECQRYCEDPSHIEECLMFSVERGEMSQEEAQRTLEMMRRGPEERMRPEGAAMRPEEEMTPEETYPEEMVPEEIVPQEIMEEQIRIQEKMIRRETEEQIKREMMEQMMPPEGVTPPETEPQSFFQDAKNFLGDIAGFFGF